MNAVFDWCVRLLVFLAGVLGITYKEINVWVFVLLWPLLTILLVALVVMQRTHILKLRREVKELKAK